MTSAQRWTIAFLAIAPAILAVALRPHMLASVPIHYNINGQADGFTTPRNAVIFWSLLTTGVGLLLLGGPLIMPMRANFQRFGLFYGRMAIALMVGIACITLVGLLDSIGRHIPITAAMTLILGGMLACIGNWMGKIRRNFWCGFRTPWTLANDVVWERTHRVGARLMVLFGLAMAISGLLMPSWVAVVVTLAGAIALAAWSFIYSAWLYHHLGAVDDMARAE